MTPTPLILRDGHRLWWPLTVDAITRMDGHVTVDVLDASGDPVLTMFGSDRPDGFSAAMALLFAAVPELVVSVEHGINRGEITGKAATELRELLARVGR